MKSKINKILGVLLTLVVLSSFAVGLAIPASAAGEAWSVMPTPGVGMLGNYIMGPAAGVTAGPAFLTKAIDGTLYAYWSIGEADDIYKSTDGGHVWTRCSNGTDNLTPAAVPIAIVCSPSDAKTVYLLTFNGAVNEVFRSTDAGANFSRLVTPDQSLVPTAVLFPGSATCMAVGYNGGSHFIYIGGLDAFGAFADVIMMKDSFGSTWATTGYKALLHTAVLTVATTPTFDTDAQPQVIAIGIGPFVPPLGPPPPPPPALECFVNWSYGGGAWSLDSAVVRNYFIEDNNPANIVDGATINGATIAFPTSGYNSASVMQDFFIGLSSTVATDGDVYEQIGLSPIDKNVQAAGTGTNITTLAVTGGTGSAYLLAAGPSAAIIPAGQNDIWHSEDNGDNWDASKKDVASQTIGAAKYLVMADDYADSGKAWVAVAAGALLDEASVAGTADFGVSWTDYSLINTNINQINNMEASPDHANDGTVFILTSVSGAPGLDSLWKGTGTAAADGSYWMRVATIAVGNAASAQVQCTPKYATDKTVFMMDNAGGFGYRATDGGLYFKKQISTIPALGPFGALLVTGPTTLYIGRGNAVVSTLNNGTSWIPTFIAGATLPIQSLAVASNMHLIAGDSGGRVFRSTDTGFNYFQLPLGVAIPGGGALNVAFDAGYSSNNTVYAASAALNAVYRLVVDTDTSWQRIDGLPVVTWPGVSTPGGTFNANPLVAGIKATPDGALYVTDSAAVGGGAAGPDAFTLTDTAGGDAGTLTVNSGSIVVAVAAGAPVIVPGTYAAGTTIAWGTPVAGDAFSVTANALNTTGVWGETAGTTVPVITSDADGDASAVLNFIPLSGSYSLPDVTGAAGAANARVLLRSVNPTASTAIARGVYFEPMSYRFAGNAANLVGVWSTAGSNVLFTLESAVGASRVWTYTDDLTAAPKLSEPADESNTGRTTSAMLTWEALSNCPKYEIWVSQNDSFSPIIPGGAGFSDTTAWTATNLLPGVTYYWKACAAASNAAQPGRALSPWSETWSFTTGISAAEWNPFSDPENVAPSPGASGVAIKPTFQWNPADWATGYEFELSTSPTTGADGFFSTALKSLKDASALTNVTWQCDSDLNYSTTYYWHVRAISATSKSVWANGVFTTMDKPVPPPEPTPPVVIEQPAPITPAWIWAIVIIGAILVIAVIVLIVTTRRVP